MPVGPAQASKTCGQGVRFLTTLCMHDDMSKPSVTVKGIELNAGDMVSIRTRYGRYGRAYSGVFLGVKNDRAVSAPDTNPWWRLHIMNVDKHVAVPVDDVEHVEVLSRIELGP